jgi:hypothetical protein
MMMTSMSSMLTLRSTHLYHITRIIIGACFFNILVYIQAGWSKWRISISTIDNGTTIGSITGGMG